MLLQQMAFIMVFITVMVALRERRRCLIVLGRGPTVLLLRHIST